MKVLIIGSGFMGTSLALKLKQKNSEASVSCIEQNSVVKAEVDQSDIYDETYYELNEVSDSYDGVIVCTNIEEVKNNVEKCQKKFTSSTFITDISSTKKHISALVDEGYVSSHPICGSEQSGPTTANASVFDGARVVVVGHNVERVKNFANSMKVDVASKEGDHIGPVVSKTQFDKIQSLIQVGIDEGAKLVAGGTGKPDGLDKGYFVKPTAFADVNNQMQIARTEIFGPVLSIIPFETEEEAIAIANDTPYGLLNFIQTQDQEKANRVARKLRSGMVDINGAGLAPDAPFGGYKHSGIGREAGKLGLEEFLEVKAVSGWND